MFAGPVFISCYTYVNPFSRDSVAAKKPVALQP